MPSPIPSYYIPPPYPSHSSHLPKRPKVYDNLFSTLDSSNETDNPVAPLSREQKQFTYQSKPLSEKIEINNELKNLKHSISERNLNDKRRTNKELELINNLIKNHKLELLEFEKTKKELIEQKEMIKKFKNENEKLQKEFEEFKKSNKKALKILMNLQKDEFLFWSGNQLKPYLKEIELGIKFRIKNWQNNNHNNINNQRNKDKDCYKRSSSPEFDLQENQRKSR
ncbi:uncharacterized protein I206_103609 [Kwoniella pini CBS 10737]|uniref:Uncharacterized protein n=1 Tax=Kwoniella pini CBS 10737 TaxID=1296096 RepID=A0A1B9I9G3_9TREE|nr:uncharacterized protein I206_01388 [Kwoniella pini CBS 10737]OCF52103.1 hypothetical protein I206_01388 [Kwoniella pini CBS 10737]